MTRQEVTLRDINIIMEKYKKGVWAEMIAKYIEDNYSRRNTILSQANKTGLRKIKISLATPDEIVTTVLDFFQMDMEKVFGKSRERHIVYVRHICLYLLSKYSRLSLKNIGRAFGGRDHTTVTHARQSISDKIDVEPETKERIQAIIKLIRQRDKNKDICEELN